ncbi:MAG TPA: DUF6010 family protein, partial [Ferruginibacter sp.]|nr:DUF6010 family protein [Ferruginibacter sp.]
YVGFTWTDTQALIVNSVQAVFFLLLAYLGMKRNLYYMAAGYFLHGAWDLVYHLFQSPDLIPPGYDLFCWSIDFTMGGYVLLLKYHHVKRVNSRVTISTTV